MGELKKIIQNEIYRLQNIYKTIDSVIFSNNMQMMQTLEEEEETNQS